MTTVQQPARPAPMGTYPPVDPGDLPSLRPLPDAMHQSPYFFDAVTTLKTRFSKDPSALVEGNTVVCYDPYDLNKRVLPNCYVAFGVNPPEIYRQNGYLIWVVGKPPDFVLEIGSKSTARRDLTEKRDLYASMGVPEYWRFDPTGGDHYGRALAGERLVGGAYEEIPLGIDAGGLACGESPTIGLSLCVREGNLVFYDAASGEYLLTFEETQSALEEAEGALHETQGALRDSQGELRETQGALRDSQGELRETQGALRDSQGALHETQAALDAARARARDLEERLRRFEQER